MISKFFINRPIFATVLALLMVLAGVVALESLPVAQFPDITPPTVQVSAVYPGASAETVARTVGAPIEEQVNGVDGMIYMSSSSSSSGQYTLTVTFEVGTDVDMATVLVQNRVNIAQGNLPEAVIQQGIVTKKQSTNIVMFLSLQSDNPMYDGLYLSNYASLNLTDQLSRLPGVGAVTVFGTGNATQVNTITTAIDSALINYGVIEAGKSGTLNLIIGIVLAALIALILLGGIKRIGRVTEKLVPFMAVVYILLALGVILLNIKNVPGVFASIFEGAFSPASVTGGAVGSFFMSMKKGVSRGIFSNEAGLGTGSIAHACADTQKPVKQGFFGIFEVFVDTIVICTMTALVILCSGVSIGYGEAAGAELTINGFTSTYGNWVSIFTAVAMCCFAFSTILGWGLYGTRCIEFLFGSKVNKPFMVLYSLVAIVGATMDLGLMWSIAETFNGLMAIPNLLAVFLLSGVVVKLVKEYFENEGKK